MLLSYKKNKLGINLAIPLYMLVLTSCQVPKEEKIDHDYSYLDQPYQGHYKIGKPYKIKGKWYYPEVNEMYSEIGEASWYGGSFHGEKTANGDIYNSKSLTAAHRTLPLPSMVRVTNLENGHSVIVMVNDRGPFAKNRIIDVSERTADLLEFKNKGIAQVKIEYLPKQTKELREHFAMKTPCDKKVDTVQKAENDIQDNDSKLYIQIGAYKNKETANKQASIYANFGDVKVTKITRNNVPLYRVRIGPIDKLSDAKEIIGRVKSASNANIMLTNES